MTTDDRHETGIEHGYVPSPLTLIALLAAAYVYVKVREVVEYVR